MPTDSADELPTAQELGLTRLIHVAATTSTMDLAHDLAAAGEPAGVMVLADHQSRGRGRGGHRWESQSGDGIWFTLVERPADARVVDVLSLRLGLALAGAVTPLVDGDVRVKWPNDLFVGTGKLSGVLVEARWRDAAVDWVAIGIGINRRVPMRVPDASSLRAGISRAQALRAVVPALRRAAALEGPLTAAECAQWRVRDLARGRRVLSPVAGVVDGLSADGALLIDPADGGALVPVRTGSIVFAEAPQNTAPTRQSREPS